MFNMNSAMLNSLMKSQLKKLKKVKVEFVCETNNFKKQYRITDHNLFEQGAYLILEELNTGEKAQLNFKL